VSAANMPLAPILAAEVGESFRRQGSLDALAEQKLAHIRAIVGRRIPNEVIAAMGWPLPISGLRGTESDKLARRAKRLASKQQ
jgi:hypothetical protein